MGLESVDGHGGPHGQITGGSQAADAIWNNRRGLGSRTCLSVARGVLPCLTKAEGGSTTRLGPMNSEVEVHSRWQLNCLEPETMPHVDMDSELHVGSP